jgi:lysophospholipase L1-like esterase
VHQNALLPDFAPTFSLFTSGTSNDKGTFMHQPTILEDGQTFLFIGDSITDCGRRDDAYKPLGNGYVHMFNDMLIIREPQKHIRVINTGVGGDTIHELRNRWVDECLSFSPDWISIRIGVNDATRLLCKQGPDDYAPATFEKILDELLAISKRNLPNSKFLLIDPFLGSVDTQGDLPESYRSRLGVLLQEYIDAIHRMSVKYETRLVKTHEAFQRIFQHQLPFVFFPKECVHPNSTGHALIAEGVYQALT